MNRKLQILTAVVVMLLALALFQPAYADSPSPAAANNVSVEITINSAGEMTVGGLSLKGLGLAPIDSQTVQIVKNLNNAHLTLEGSAVNVEIQGMPAMKIEWSPASRKTVVDLAAQYGLAISPDVMARAEEWITSSNVDVTARYTQDASKPLSLSLSKMLWVDLAADGRVAIEKGPLAYAIDPSYMPLIRQSGAKNATACYNKGTLLTKVDGRDLPAVTLYKKGLQVLSQQLNLGIDQNPDPWLAALLGVDIQLPGGTHANATCGQ